MNNEKIHQFHVIDKKVKIQKNKITEYQLHQW